MVDKQNEVSQSQITPLCTLKGHTNDVTSVDFSGKNLLATGSSDKTIRLYKWQAGDTFVELPSSPLLGHTYGVNCVVFSPFSTKLASSSTDGTTILWDVKTGDNLCVLKTSRQSAAIRTCTFASNSSLLAAGGDDDEVAVWDVSTLSLLRQVGGHEGTVTGVSFTPDSSYLMTGSSAGDLRLWDGVYGHGRPLAIKPEAHDLGVSCLQFSPSVGKEGSLMISKQYLLATGGQDTDINLWKVEVGSPYYSSTDPSKSAKISLHHTLCGHQAPVTAVRFTLSGFILGSASQDKTVRLWDPVRLVPLPTLEGHKRYVTSCAFSDDGTLVAAGGGDRSTRVWKIDPLSISAARGSGSIHFKGRQLLKYPSQKLWENKKLIDWTVEDISSWLLEQGLAEYASNFRHHAIDGREMLSMTEEVLEHKLGVDALGHRRKIMRLVQKFSTSASSSLEQVTNAPPVEYVCPITHEIMGDPVICADGFTYERAAMEAWLASGKRTSPMTNEKLAHFVLTPNRTLKNLINKYREENS